MEGLVKELVRVIDRLSENMRQSMEKYREEDAYRALFRLTITQLHYLHRIRTSVGILPSELARYFHVQKPTVTNILKRLESCGYIRREPSKEDGRICHIYLTAEGEHLLDLESAGYASFAESAARSLSAKEQEELLYLLRKME